jgi:hypothetical protein
VIRKGVGAAVSGDGSVIKTEGPKIQRPYNTRTERVKCLDNSDTGNDRGKWNCLRMLQKIAEHGKY